MIRNFLFVFLVGACSPAESNAPSEDVDAGVDIDAPDTSMDSDVVVRTRSLELQVERLAVGATQVVTVLVDGRPFDGEVEWTVVGDVLQVSPMAFQAQSPGQVELTAVVEGELLSASFEVITPTWTSVSSGPRTTCVLDASGNAYCMGQQGNDASSTLKKVPGGHVFQEISVGSSLACGIASGDVYCWGENTGGQMGVGADVSWSAEPLPVLVGNDVKEISAGLYFVCASSTDKSWCWGESYYYQTGRSNSQYEPVELRFHVRGLSAGHYHVCGIRDDGVAACWGGNFEYQIEAINRNSFDSAYPVSQANEFESIHAGRFHTCGRAFDGVVTCWGNYPSNPPGFFNHKEIGRTFRDLSVNGVITCGLDALNSLECLGSNELGALGVGTIRDDWATLPGRWWKFDGSNFHGCALDLSGELFCWGTNYSGGVGQPLQPVMATPAELVGISADQMAFAEGVICWLEAGMVNCRGESTEGLLGDSRLAPSVHSAPLLPAGNYTGIYASGKTACALSDMGDVYCWGIWSGFDFHDVGHPVKVTLPGPATDVFLGPAWHHVVALADGTFRDWDSVNYSPLMTAQHWMNDATQQPINPTDYQHLKYTRVALTQSKEIHCGGPHCDAAASWGMPDLGISDVESIHLVNDVLCALDGSGVLSCVRETQGGRQWVAEDWPFPILAASHDADVICVVDSEGVACMGSNRGQVQLMPPDIQAAELHRIPGTQGATAVRVGFANACAKISEKWMCWGDNRAGQVTKTEMIFQSPAVVNR